MATGHLLGELVTVQAAAAPDTVAVQMENGERLTFGTLDKRSNRLGRALVAMGIEPRQRVALLCCEDHPGDLMVAYVGVQKAGAISVVLPPAAATDDLAGVLRMTEPRLVIACSEGLEAWKAAKVPARVVGDAPDVVWWKALELKHPPDPFQVPGRADEIAEVVVHPADDGTWTTEELTHTRVLELVAGSRAGAPPPGFWGWNKRLSVEETLIEVAASGLGIEK
jgi:non-ribosomal peptide synthetase component F